LRSCSWYF